MNANIRSQNDQSVTIEVTIPFSSSMLESEENITSALNDVGCLAVKESLKRFDTDGSAIMVGNTKLTSKGRYNKTFQTIWGAVDVERHVYQSSKGGKQYYPLENSARILLTSTPGFARLLSSKYAEMGSVRTVFDLEQNHQRPFPRSHLKRICDAVGAVAQAKEESWTYELPELNQPVASVAVGIDGTCMLLTDQGWREAMVGTLSCYDKDGTRLHTIQIGATPEYGKASFYQRFERELDRLKQEFTEASFIGVADGAHSNWTYLEGKTDDQTLDYWHATEYLAIAAKVMYPLKKQDKDRAEWLDNARHNLKHKVGAAARLLREMMDFIDLPSVKEKAKEQLSTVITYFKNNKERMKYAKNRQKGLPIGSGVTEAACKTLIKQRLCNSGMRWKEKGAAAVISLRALSHTDCRWQQFWQKVNQYGYPADFQH